MTVSVLFSAAFAEVAKPNDDFWYLDEANVLSEATEGEIFFANQRLYDACGAEIVVAAIDSTGSMAIDDYAYTMFNDWQIGGNSYRGLLLLMAIEDENYYVMPGTAMSLYFDSATVGEMMDTYLEPDFAAGKYDSGARRFFEAAYEKVVDDLNLNLSIADAVADYEAFVREENISQNTSVVIDAPVGHRASSTGAGPVLLVMLLALFIILRSSRRYPRQSASHYRAPRSSSMMTGFILGRMSSGRRMRPGPGPFGASHMGGRPYGHNPGGMHRSSRPGGGFSSRSSGGFGGAGRSSFGGTSRSGGFGGASRSGGASRGPSTRGGGAGRFSR